MPSEEHYNDAESNYFLLFVIALVGVPSTIWFVKRKVLGHGGASGTIQCKCSLCEAKGKEKAAKEGGFFTFATMVQLVLIVGIWAVFFLVLSNTSSIPEDPTKTLFDPYKILNLDYSATTEEIKKAYRQMSLKYHPDKAEDPSDQAVQDRFIQINKAYESLTDELARANWEKYGNPDGPRAQTIGIALPSWLVRKDNTAAVLSVYLILLIVGVPLAVGCWWRSWRKYDTTKVMNSTMGLYYHKVEQLARVKVISELIGASQEYQAIPVRNSDDQNLTRVAKMIPEAHAMKKKPKYTIPYAIKTNALFYAQMSRLQAHLSPGLRGDLEKILLQVRSLLGGFITISTAKGLLVPILEGLQFLQQLTQSTWNKEDLLQLPHITPYILDLCNSKKKNCGELSRFIALGAEKRKALLVEEGLNEQQVADVETVLQYLPTDVSLQYDCVVEGDDSGKIPTGSVVTCSFNLVRGVEDDESDDESDSDDSGDEKDRKAKREAREQREEKRMKKRKEETNNDIKRMVHAPYFPEKREESWWVVIGDPVAYTLVGIHKIGGFNKRAEGKIKFLAPQKPGIYNYMLYLLCDGYLGCDKHKPIKLQVVQDTSANNAAVEPASRRGAKGLPAANSNNNSTPTTGAEEDDEFSSEGSDYDSDPQDDDGSHSGTDDESDSGDADNEPKKKK